MNNVVANFDQIINFAEQTGVPLVKKRGILREYLQTKFISFLYAFTESKRLSFVGGTSMRLLRGLNRFSEDLDFDNLGLNDQEINSLVNKAASGFKKENVQLELIVKEKVPKTFFELRFPHLLKELSISSNPREKLMIKVDYSDLWRGQKVEGVLMNRYGFLESVITNPLNQLLVQKLTAYVKRKQTQPRDIYDIVWLVSQGAKMDQSFLRVNKLSNLVDQARKKLGQQKVGRAMRNKLKPFLFDESQISRLDLFEAVLGRL